MGVTAEHQFISQEIDKVLSAFSKTQLLGITEAQRRTFDYACMMMRDFSRPLVAQVLWSHNEGIEKDIRTLLYDQESLLKVYFIKNTTPVRARVDEITASFRSNPQTRKLLAGFRPILIPSGFNADKLEEQAWMSQFLKNEISKDLLFNIVFGNLTRSEFLSFADHLGPNGLKYAMLHIINKFGIKHFPTFMHILGYKSRGPIDKALIMLKATGIVKSLEMTNICIPTIKGRLLVDFTRKLLFEHKCLDDWSDETKLILSYLGVRNIAFQPTPKELRPKEDPYNLLFNRIIYPALHASDFGQDIMEGIDINNPRFFSEYRWEHFYHYLKDTPQVDLEWFSDPSSLLFTDGEDIDTSIPAGSLLFDDVPAPLLFFSTPTTPDTVK